MSRSPSARCEPVPRRARGHAHAARLARTVLSGLLIATALPRPAYGQIGIVGGYNRDFLRGLEANDGFSFTDEATGFHLGIFLNIRAGPFGVRPAILYHRISKLEFAAGERRNEFDLEIVEVPLDFRLRLGIPVVRPYVLAGPVFMFPSSPRRGIDNALETGPARLDIGFGLEWTLGLRLWPEVRYGFGLTDFLDANAIPIGDTTFSGTGTAKLDSFMLRLGVSF